MSTIFENVLNLTEELLRLTVLYGKKATIDDASVRRPENPYLDAIVGGTKWDVSDDHVITIDLDPTFRSDFPWTQDEHNNIRHLLDSVESIIKVKFEFFPSSSVSTHLYPDEERNMLPPANLQWVKQDLSTASGKHVGPEDATDNWLLGVFDSGRNTWNLSPGSDSYETIIHELGHALGLAHPYDERYGSTLFPGYSQERPAGEYGLSTIVNTVMAGGNTVNRNGDGVNLTIQGNAASFMAFDIAALQHMYGANDKHAQGPDTYELRDDNVWSCIWDTKGIDEIVYNGSKSVEIDLRAAFFVGQNAGGYLSKVVDGSSGFTIAHGVDLENATAGRGSDKVTGNYLNNSLKGGAGFDSLQGGPGADTIDGGAITDTVDYGDNEIMVYTQSYGFSNIISPLVTSAQLYLDLGNESAQIVQLVSGHNASDNMFGLYPNIYSEKLVSIEDAIGTSFGDIMQGSERPNSFVGGDGPDQLSARGEKDRLYGGIGRDILTGGTEADRFIFNSGDSGVGRSEADVITDFHRWEGDKIDLAKNVKSFVGLNSAPVAGEVSYFWEEADTIVRFNHEGELNDIVLADVNLTMQESDFIF